MARTGTSIDATSAREASPAGGGGDAPVHRAHVPALDGYRGVAVMGVLAVHAGASWAMGGWVTLVAFFVLSGYLITTLLLRERDRTGSVSLGRFYLRRARRLLPALVVLLAALTVYDMVVADSIGTQHLGGLILGTLFYYADLQASRGHVPLFSLLAHSYSLSIEEQFYFLWPLVLAGLVRLRQTRAQLAVVVAALGLPAIVLRVLLWHGPGSEIRIYYAPDTRYDALLLGCALAVLLSGGGWRRVPAAAVRIVSGVSVLVLAVLFVGTDWHSGLTLQVWMVAAAVFATTALWVVATQPAALMTRVLAWAPFVRVGQISYGIYLWHWPIFMILNTSTLGLPWWETQVVRLILTGAASLASYHLVETRFLRPNKGASIALVTSPTGA